MVHMIFFIIISFSILCINKKHSFWIYSFVGLFLFCALRYNYGPDYMNYFEIFYLIKEGLPAWGQSDWLFKQLVLLMPNFYILVAILSLFYVISIYILISANLQVKDYWFALLMLLINPYLFLVHQSSIRQTISICIIILAIKYAINRNILKYVLLIILASGFHASAIIMLPVYLVLTDKKLKIRDILIAVGVIFALLFTPMFNMIINRALEYMPSHYYIYYDMGLQNSLRSTLISSVFFFFVLFNINKLDGHEIVYGKLSLISTIISLLAIKASMITRIGMYFDIFLIITIPHIFNNIEKKLHRILVFILLMTIYLLRYYSFYSLPICSKAFGTYRTILGL